MLLTPTDVKYFLHDNIHRPQFAFQVVFVSKLHSIHVHNYVNIDRNQYVSI